MAKLFQYGLYYITHAFRDSNGYPMGDLTTPDAPTADTAYHGVLLQNPVEYTPPEPSFLRAIDKGGQKIRGQKDMGVDDYGTGSIVLSEFNNTFHAHVTGGVVDSTQVSGWDAVGSNVNKVTKPSFFLMVTTKAYDYAAAADVWSTWIYLNCQITPTFPGASQSDGENPNPVTYTIVPNTSTRDVSGELLSGTLMALEDNTDLVIHRKTDYPLGLTTYKEHATVPTNTYITGYRPQDSTVDDSSKLFTENGVVIAATSHDTTTGVVVTSGNSTSSISVCLYETEYTAI